MGSKMKTKLSLSGIDIPEVSTWNIDTTFPEIDDIKKITLKKGDILVLRYDRVLSVEACKNLKESFKCVLDKVGLREHVAIMILEKGLDLSAVLTQDEGE